MRSVEALPFQAMLKTRELHTFECPNCRRTERKLVSTNIIGSFQTERMQLASTLPLVTSAMHDAVIVSRSGWTCAIRTFRDGIVSASALTARVLAAARNARARATARLRPPASVGTSESFDPPVETSAKYDTARSFKVGQALRSMSVASLKVLGLAQGVINHPRRDRICVRAGLALILVVLFHFFEQGRNMAAVPTEASQAGQASTATSSAPTAPPSESRAAAAALTTTSPASATEQKAAPDPLASLDPADRVIAEKIRDLLAARPGTTFASRREHEAVEAFYQKRNLAAFWLDKGAENARAKSVIARIKDAAADGLELSDYKLPDFAGLGPDALAEADVKLTQTVLTFARHLQAGRFPYHLVSRNIQLPQAVPEPSEVLSRISAAADAGEALDEFSPQQAPYRKLKTALAQLRGQAGGARSAIAQGPVLSYGRKRQVEDPRVPLLRERLKLAGDPSDLRYDGAIADAVKKYQAANQLPATGSLDARTVRELNASTHDNQIETIIANMERWRWYPRELGDAHVVVNQPDFTLEVMHDGVRVWTTRVVIGKPSMPTPLLSETMKSITINPTWNVPPSIVHNEYLPALAQDPTVLARMGLRVSYSGNGEVQITQPPGPGNALGRIRFNFPNRFLVYQHDTPDKYMFGQDLRAESHGCMRVQDPAKYAEVLFNIARPDDRWTAEKVTSAFGKGEQDIQLQPAQIWVHLTYQTAFVDDDGKLQMRRDVYNLDSRTIAAIKRERAMIETIPERNSEQVSASGPGARTATTPRFGSFFPFRLFGSPLRPPRGIY
ncbi:MAG TPA: L,D-transpeptidase family protein [Xanthobacteraceae bacterium]|jgi:murein L,D-transpeptidase YcbB/YkuD